MDKRKKQSIPGQNDRLNEEMWDVVRKNFDFGGGAELSITSHKSKNDKQGVVSHFFSSRMPKLKIKSKTTKERMIDVEISSIEEDNQSLLHFLFKKSR